MRKIKRHEIRAAAEVLAKAFNDYPLYNAFFADDEKKEMKISYFFWYRLYTRQKYTYISEDGKAIVCFKQPGDEDVSPLSLFCNPKFAFGYLYHVGLSVLLKVAEYSELEEKLLFKYFNPNTDCIVQIVYVDSSSSESILNLSKELYQGNNVFCETHTDKHVRFYQHLGVKVLEEVEWRGVKHYLMGKTEAAAAEEA